MTNEERIKGMTTEELAEWLFESVDCFWCPAKGGCKALTNEGCRERFAEWLKETAKETAQEKEK